jgi:hypothetical protein
VTVNNRQVPFIHLLVLLICCLLAYWPLTFHLFSLKNDALNYFLPVRYQISDLISHGFWPFWSPYFNLGYPLHGDMQSGVWNPVVQIFSLFGPYTLKTLQCETLLYIYLSGVGMFFLANYFTKNSNAALLAGVSFMLCGFNSDSAQFLNWISASSFLPFTFLFYYRTVKEQKWQFALATSIFLWLLFTTAYPADFILTAYALLFVLILNLFKKDNRTKVQITRLIKLHAAIAISFIILCLPAILSYAEFLPLTERGSGASYEEVMSNPLHPGLLFSWLAPLPAWKASFAVITDPLERNSYFGITSFALVLLSFLTPSKNRLIRYCKWAFIVSLLFSFGEMGGIRIIGYYVLPLMKTFRHPANAKLFTIFFGCLLAAFMYAELQINTINYNKQKSIVVAILSLAFLILVGWALAGNLTILHAPLLSFHSNDIKRMLDSISFSDLLLLNLLIQVPFLIGIFLFLTRKIKSKSFLVLGIINSIIIVMLVQPFTVVKKDAAETIQNVLNSVQEKGFPKPDLNATLAANSSEGMKYFDQIGTANMYNKKIGRVDYRITPSNLLSENTFWFSERARNILLNYPLLYKADTIVRLADTSKIKTGEKKFLILDDPVKNPQVIGGNYTSTINSFNPDLLSLNLSTTAGYYCLFQNYYPRWKLFIDGKPAPVLKVNLSFIGFYLPAGNHTVNMIYKATDLKFGFIISVAFLILLLAFIVTTRHEHRSALAD